VVQNLQVTGISVTGGSGATLIGNQVGASGITLDGTTAARVIGNLIAASGSGITLTGGASNPVIGTQTRSIAPAAASPLPARGHCDPCARQSHRGRHNRDRPVRPLLMAD